MTSLGSAVGPLQEGALAVRLSFRDLGLEPEAARQIRLSLTDAVDGLSGVEETAVSSSGLFGFTTSLCASGSGPESTFAAADVSAGFFRALGVRYGYRSAWEEALDLIRPAEIRGQQYVAVSTNDTIFAFALRQ